MIGWIREAAGDPTLEPDIERVAAVPFGIDVAERLRDGSVFLIGDAAHRVTPRGATGMNTAIRDGFDLGWKLAWVMRGWAGDALLDSYEAERRPVAEHNAARSADPSGSIRSVTEELRADLGGRIAHLWLPGEDGASVDARPARRGPHGVHRPARTRPEDTGALRAASSAPVTVARGLDELERPVPWGSPPAALSSSVPTESP